MKAIFKHELSGFFNNISGCVYGAFLLLFGGIYTLVYNLRNGLTNFEYVIAGMVIIFLIAVPVLTMKIIAEERRQKTDTLLYSLPVSMTRVILGKYLAMLVVMMIPLCIIGIYPLILRSYGEVNLATVYGTLFAFFLLGAALTAMGMFISSITESQAVAAGLCFAVMLLNYFVSSLASYVSDAPFASFLAFFVLFILAAAVVRIMTRSRFAAILAFLIPNTVLLVLFSIKSDMFESLFPKIMDRISLFERFYPFAEGMFDITNIVYLISVAVLFVFLTVQSMEKRRYS